MDHDHLSGNAESQPETAAAADPADPRMEAQELRAELRVLSEFIQTARAELAALSPRDIQDRFIPTASDELDAIVQATETATDEIMDAAEALEDMTPNLDPKHADTLTDATTRIYQACSFQDITGQRITKVVRTLKSIEERVDAMVLTYADPAMAVGDAATQDGAGQDADPDDLNRFRKSSKAVGDKAEDGALLNGPQAAESAMDQADIDALLNFD